MKLLRVLLYRPYQGHFRAFIYDDSGIGKNLLSGYSVTSEVSAMTRVVAYLHAKYPGVGVEFETREGDREHEMKYRLPSGKVVTVR